MSNLAAQDRDAALIGSLATGRFRLHSDIDLLVRSPVDPVGRAAVERAVSPVMRGTEIPYELIYSRDLTEPQRDAFARDAAP